MIAWTWQTVTLPKIPLVVASAAVVAAAAAEMMMMFVVVASWLMLTVDNYYCEHFHFQQVTTFLDLLFERYL